MFQQKVILKPFMGTELSSTLSFKSMCEGKSHPDAMKTVGSVLSRTGGSISHLLLCCPLHDCFLDVWLMNTELKCTVVQEIITYIIEWIFQPHLFIASHRFNWRTQAKLVWVRMNYLNIFLVVSSYLMDHHCHILLAFSCKNPSSTGSLFPLFSSVNWRH